MTETTAVSRVQALICRFQLAFDLHDWTGLAECVTDPVHVDYSGLRGGEPQTMSAAEYADARRRALDHLDLQHNHGNLVVRRGKGLTAMCNFQIHRFSRTDEGQFHSWGRYHFEFEDVAGHLRFSRIRQELTASRGDSSLHGGVAPTR